MLRKDRKMNNTLEEYGIIWEKIERLDVRECVLLGIFSISRTQFILENISSQKGFEKAREFLNIVDIISSMFLDGGLKGREFITKYEEVYEDLARACDEYSIEEQLPQNIECMMECKETLIGLLYSVTFIEYSNLTEEDKKYFKEIYPLGLDLIEQYLTEKNLDIKDNDKLEELICNHPLWLSEVKRIDDDIKFVMKNNISKEVIKKRIDYYKNLDILDIT